jgi:1-acyl-sn-glycerol-3-phosphate acyltransferase
MLWPPMMTITRREWSGAEHVGKPGDGLVVAANHMSWFDPMVIAHFMNDNDRALRFLAKDRLFEVPIAGRIIAGAGQIPVYRHTTEASDAVRAAVAAVNAGEAVVVYTDGTLTRDPDLWPMMGKTGAARIALLSGKPVVPLAHWGAQDVMGPYRKEFHAFPPKRVKVTAGPPVDLDDLRSRELTTDVLIEATSRIVDAITHLLGLLRGQTPPVDRWNPKSQRREAVPHPLPREAVRKRGKQKPTVRDRHSRTDRQARGPARLT